MSAQPKRYRKELEQLRRGLKLIYTESAIERIGAWPLVAHDALGLAAMRERDAEQADQTSAHYRDVYCGGGTAPDMVERFKRHAADMRKAAARWKRIAAEAQRLSSE